MLNELIKMFKKKSTIIAIIIIVLFSVATQLILKMAFKSVDEYFKINEYDNLEQFKKEIKESSGGKLEKSDELFFEYASKMGIENVDDYRIGWVRNIITLYSDDDSSQLCCEFESKQNDYYGDSISSDIKISYDEEAIKKAFDKLIKSKYDYSVYLELMKDASSAKFSNEELESAIVNPYKYLYEEGVNDVNDWRVQRVAQLMTVETQLDSMSEREAEYGDVLGSYNELLYSLENNEEHYISESFVAESSMGYANSTDKISLTWEILLNSSFILTVLSACMVVLAGQIVAKEYSEGTIKFLLINPIKRGKIIISKYLTILTLSFGLTLFAFVLSILVNIIVAGGKGLGIEYINYSMSNKAITTMPALLYYFKTYMISFVEVVVYETMAFAISSLLKSTAAAVGVGIGCMFTGSVVTLMLVEFGQDWGRFLIFANSDLSSVMKGNAAFPGMTLSFSIGVILVHMIVFLLSAYDGFVRREV